MTPFLSIMLVMRGIIKLDIVCFAYGFLHPSASRTLQGQTLHTPPSLLRFIRPTSTRCSHSTRDTIQHIVNTERYPLDSQPLIEEIRNDLQQKSAITLDGFIRPSALQQMVEESLRNEHLAYYTNDMHNIYLSPTNPNLPPDHISNHQVITNKGCITTDQIPPESPLKALYYNTTFQRFLSHILEVEHLYPYEDPLSSLTVHYGGDSQELGWHFDNSAFAITLLLQQPSDGGVFEYIPNIRVPSSSDADEDENENVTGFRNEVKPCHEEEVRNILHGTLPARALDLQPGTLTLFRGRDSLHRVTKVVGERKRVLVVLAYNEIPGQKLPDETMMTFFGRTA